MILGIAGTAKNTGKTTTLSALLEEGRRRGILPALTGIGYDGEERDTVTSLPKPRIQVYPGMIVTTSERCVHVSTARGGILTRTGFRTPLGEVLILRITHPGLLVVAGPNKTAELKDVCGLMWKAGAGAVFVDGSLNRIAPFAVAGAVIFATGAARSTDAEVVRKEVMAIETIFGFGIDAGGMPHPGSIGMAGSDVHVRLARGSVHGRQEMERAVAMRPPGFLGMEVPGVITEEGLRVLSDAAAAGKLNGDVVFDDPIKMLLGGDPSLMSKHLVRCEEAGLHPRYRTRPALKGFTINPAYPAFDGTIYTPASVEAEAFVKRIRDGAKTPVFDLVGGGGVSSLFDSAVGSPPLSQNSP
jgi:hypothetical protein